MVKEIAVLRYGHRLVRDARVTTHCCLTARALGASQIVLAGERDEKLKEEIEGIVKEWGGGFKVGLSEDWKKSLKAFRKKGFTAVHLTMYGEPLQKVSAKLREKEKILLIVGSQKVPGEMYGAADFNVAVTGQPHSEIAALAVALHELFGGRELDKKFSGAKRKIVPQSRGKKVLKQS